MIVVDSEHAGREAPVADAYTLDMRERIEEQLASAGLAVSPGKAEKLAEFLELLGRWNRVHNLTAITDADEMTRRHLMESLALQSFLRGDRIADVGSGAGLPGVPLAIVEPTRQFTLIESRAKRASFLSHVQGALGLGNVRIEHGRAEDLRGGAPFATVLARAVAPLPDLVELTEHLLDTDGVLLVLTKGDIEAVVGDIDSRFRVRRVDEGASKLLAGALVAIEPAGA